MRHGIRSCGRLLEEGRTEEALDGLRQLLRGAPEAGVVIRAGSVVQRALGQDPSAPLLRILGQCTTTWVAQAAAAVALDGGMPLRVSDGPFDNVVQELLATAPAEAPAVWVLLPWTRTLLADRSAPIAERVERELEGWRLCWKLVHDRGARLVQVGYDLPVPGPSGFQLDGRIGDTAAVRAANVALREHLPPGAAFVDLDLVAGQVGRERFYDARSWHWTKQPFSEEGVVRLARHVVAGARSVLTGPRKVLVLDLDNTLWGGVVGEEGPLGVALGDTPDGGAFRAFQSYCRELSRRGVVLAVSSKNNEADALEPFRCNPDMVLKLDDFAAFRASWDPKDVAIRQISDQICIGTEHFVFFDDNPAERERIRQMLPEVLVVEVPADPSEYVAALATSLAFETAVLTSADLERTSQYQVEEQRRRALAGAPSMAAYLASLDMAGVVRPIDDADLSRVVQLLGKTNQFNLTTRRHDEAAVRRMLALPGSLGLTFRLADRFGDHGLVGVALAVPDDGALRVDVLLMSCRVLGRTAEEFFVGEILRAAATEGWSRVVGEYLPTAKNAMVADLYLRLGFAPTTGSAAGARFQIELPAELPPTAVRVRDHG